MTIPFAFPFQAMVALPFAVGVLAARRRALRRPRRVTMYQARMLQMISRKVTVQHIPMRKCVECHCSCRVTFRRSPDKGSFAYTANADVREGIVNLALY